MATTTFFSFFSSASFSPQLWEEIVKFSNFTASKAEKERVEQMEKEAKYARDLEEARRKTAEYHKKKEEEATEKLRKETIPARLLLDWAALYADRSKDGSLLIEYVHEHIFLAKVHVPDAYRAKTEDVHETISHLWVNGVDLSRKVVGSMEPEGLSKLMNREKRRLFTAEQLAALAQDPELVWPYLKVGKLPDMTLGKNQKYSPTGEMLLENWSQEERQRYAQAQSTFKPIFKA